MKTYTMSDLNALALAREAAYLTFATKRPAGSGEAHREAREAYVNACHAYCDQTGANIWDVYRAAGTQQPTDAPDTPLPGDANIGADDEWSAKTTYTIACEDCGAEVSTGNLRQTTCEGVIRFFQLCDACNTLWDAPHYEPFADDEWTVCPRCETQVAIDDYQEAAGMCDACIADTMPESPGPTAPTIGELAELRKRRDRCEEERLRALDRASKARKPNRIAQHEGIAHVYEEHRDQLDQRIAALDTMRIWKEDAKNRPGDDPDFPRWPCRICQPWAASDESGLCPDCERRQREDRALYSRMDTGERKQQFCARAASLFASLLLALSVATTSAAEIINQKPGLPFQACEFGRTLTFEDGSSVAKCGVGWVITDAETRVRTYHQAIDPTLMQRVMLYGR